MIEFGEFVLSLSVFHPKAPLAEKAECEHRCLATAAAPPAAARARVSCAALTRGVAVAFRIYDLGATGSIERSEIRTMLAASLKEETSELRLPEAALERIIDQTFSVAAREVKLSNEDRLGPGEWRAVVTRMPSVLCVRSLPLRRAARAARCPPPC